MRLVNNYIPAPVTDTYNGREIFPSWKTCVQGAAPRHGYFHAPPPLSSLYRCSFLVRVINSVEVGKLTLPLSGTRMLIGKRRQISRAKRKIDLKGRGAISARLNGFLAADFDVKS